MTGHRKDRAADAGGHHGHFTPPTGSFEFTGENANATDRNRKREDALTLAARSFLRRVGSNA